MSLPQILARLLVVQVAAFAILLLLYQGGLRTVLLERRVRRFRQGSGPIKAPARQLRADGPVLRLFLWDLAETERAAIPWLGAQYRLGPRESAIAFAAGRLGFAILGGVGAAFLLFDLASAYAFGLIVMAAGMLVLAAANWWVARRYLAGAARARQESVSRGMPYALDLILICLDSGVALETAIARVATELSVRDPLVADELRRTLLDINILGSREQAFRNLGERIDTSNMRAIVTVLCQSLQYGSSVSVSLKEAIQNMKQVEMLSLEERAGKLPVQLTLPGMVFTLPQVIILLAGPGVVDLLETFKPL